FLKAQGDGALRQLAGVEVESGRYSDLHPAYPLLVAAAAESATFTEERMRAVGEEMLWGKEKAALRRQDNPYLMALAAEFLRTHGAAEVVDAAWGLPGSPERKKHEALAHPPPPMNACRR
ncbi:MAG: hypothetical protein ACYC8T_31015, partial [Myxococcaceae bacterium]